MRLSSQQAQRSFLPKQKYPLCHRQHNFMPRDKICMKPQCFRNNLICSKCQQEHHNTLHHCVQTVQHFKNFTIKILSRENVNLTPKIEALLKYNKQANKNIQQKIDQMQKQMNKIVEKMRKASVNQFDDAVKIYRQDTYARQLNSLNQGITQQKVSNICYKLNVINRIQQFQDENSVKRQQKNYLIAIDTATKKLQQIKQIFNNIKYFQKQQQNRNIILPQKYEKNDENSRTMGCVAKSNNERNIDKKRQINSRKNILEVNSNKRRSQNQQQSSSSLESLKSYSRSRDKNYRKQSIILQRDFKYNTNKELAKIKKQEIISCKQTPPSNFIQLQAQNIAKQPNKQDITSIQSHLAYPASFSPLLYQPYQLIKQIDSECVIVENIKRPKKNPLTMTEQELKAWFKKYYQQKQVYSLVLAHKIEGEVKYFYLYCMGQFKWFTQEFLLKNADQKVKLKSYMKVWNNFYT